MAVEITITLESGEDLQQALQRLDSSIQRNIHEQLEKWAAELREHAKSLAPVRTGKLRGSIYAEANDWTAEIGVGAEYAIFVEFGTRRMQAQPFLRPALEEHLPKLEALFLEAFDQAKMEAGPS